MNGSDGRENIVLENRLIYILCDKYNMEYYKSMNMINKIYGYELSKYDIRSHLNSLGITNWYKQQEIFRMVEDLAYLFDGANSGIMDDYIKLDAYFKKNTKKSIYRIFMIMIAKKYPNTYADIKWDYIYKLDNDEAKVLIDKSIEKIKKQTIYNKSLDAQTVEMLIKIKKLENEKKHLENIVADQNRKYKIKLENNNMYEIANFFSELNSQKYGYLLDELLLVGDGLNKLKELKYQPPLEISGIIIMVKRMLQFINDYSLKPIMNMNEVKYMSNDDIKECIYFGSEFDGSTKTKKVKVISPGWIITEKNIIVSKPQLKEVL